MIPEGKSLFVVCGEPSGETYAVNVVREFRKRFPGVPVSGIGGERLRAEGVRLVADYAGISVVGVTEVVRHLPEVWRTLRLAIREATRPEVGAVLLVDFPDFNFRVGRRAAIRKIPVVYYVPPQLWAWRKGRAKQLATFTRGVVVPFPFELDTLLAAGVNARFAGHPLLDELAPYFQSPPAPEKFGFRTGETVVGLLPGSRSGEIEKLFPPMLEAARAIRASFPSARFAVPVAAPRFLEPIKRMLEEASLDAVIVEEDRHLLFGTLVAAISASGTATLELALMGVPSVIVYRTSNLSYRIGKRLVSVKSIGLPNIVAGDPFLPELIQDDCNPARMADELIAMISDPANRERLSGRCIALRDKLRGTGPTRAVVDMLVEASEGAWA